MRPGCVDLASKIQRSRLLSRLPPNVNHLIKGCERLRHGFVPLPVVQTLLHLILSMWIVIVTQKGTKGAPDQGHCTHVPACSRQWWFEHDRVDNRFPGELDHRKNSIRKSLVNDVFMLKTGCPVYDESSGRIFESHQKFLLSTWGHWNLTKRVDFEYREHFAVLMPTIDRRGRHETGGFLTVNHVDERKHTGHGECIRRLEWRVSVSYRWCLNRDGQWSRTPTWETSPTRHVSLRWSTRCIKTCRHPISIPSTRELLFICLHLVRPRIPGETVTIILTSRE